MTADMPSPLLPKLRFPQFQGAPHWPHRLMGRYLSESRIKGTGGNEAKKLSVKLWGKGVVEKRESVEGSVNTQYYRRRAGQFIYSKLDFLNQAFGLIPQHLDGYESTVDLPCFDISPELNAKFLLEYVQREQFYKARGEIAEGGRKAKRIQVETFLECPIYAPSEPEQQKIADCFSSLDVLIAADARKLAALRQHKRGLMQQLFPIPGQVVPRLRFPRFSDAPDWQSSTIGERCKSFSGGTPDTSKTAYYGGTIPFIRSAEIGRDQTELFLTEDGLKNSAAKMVRRGDILVALYGANSGDTALARLDGAINQAILCLRSHDSAPFLSFQLAARKNWIVATYLQGGQGNLSGQIILSVPVSVPQGDEQEKVVECLSALDATIEHQAQRHNALKLQKQGLLQLLFPALEGG